MRSAKKRSLFLTLINKVKIVSANKGIIENKERIKN